MRRQWRLWLAAMIVLYAWEAASAMIVGQTAASYLNHLLQPLQGIFG